MALTFEAVCIDAHDPHALGAWWSKILGWQHHVDKDGDVVLEGLLMSHVYGRWAALADELQTSFIFAFLDTPEELCVQRVKDRRAARAEAKGVVLEPLNETNTRQKWKDNRRTYEKFRSSGHDARWLDHTRPGEILMQWLRSGK